MYTYGWQRAETLGALVNGVFLVALCVTIFLDAIERFAHITAVEQPMIVVIVGCCGLASNIVGLLLFHDHSHGGHSHGPAGHGDTATDAEEGHAHGGHDPVAANESGNVVDVLPQNRMAGWPKTQGPDTASSEGTAVESGSSVTAKVVPRFAKHRRSISRSRGIDDIPITPNAFRKSIIDASRLEPVESDEGTDNEDTTADEDHGNSHEATEQSLLSGSKQNGYGSMKRKSIDHHEHKHAQPKEAGKAGGHSHGDLNMRGILLHVLGDALGNIGVIASGLFIWLTKYSWRFYVDPAASLLITCIILGSAIPLCKAASRILLQAVPHGISVDDIKEDIESLEGIISCHHLHVWQLSDTKLVASLHVQVGFDFKSEGSARYMQLAQGIRQCLHEYGIHSSTIQPEFCLDPDHDHVAGESDAAHDDAAGGSPQSSGKRSKLPSRVPSKANSMREADACLLDCNDDCGGANKSCCAPAAKDGHDDHDGHSHAH